MRTERKAAVMLITENIEMDLFSSEESCVGVQTQEAEEKYVFDQRHREHPLVLDDEEEPALQAETQMSPNRAKPNTEPPTKEEVNPCPPVQGTMEEVEIEMEVFPPLRAPDRELLKGDDSVIHQSSPNKVSHLKWKRLVTHNTGLVVKDVVCLPRGHWLAELDRHTVPRGRDRASLVTTRLNARITIDSKWSACQMQNRLAMLFQEPAVKRLGQKFSFTYLQCVQGSSVLFVPDTPAEGWTGQQVLRICEHGALYILWHQNQTQAESKRPVSETPASNRNELRVDDTMASCTDEDGQLGGERLRSPPSTAKEKRNVTLDSLLSLFRQETLDRDAETHVYVKRSELLQGALKVVTKPGFCFRKTPIISFIGEETDGHEGPLREFFRLALLELQESSVFEGLPGRLFLTYDLSALEERKYYKAGVLIGWSVVQGGPGPRCLHPALYQLMCGRNPSLEDFSWSDIIDAEAQTQLQQLHRCTNVSQLSPSLCDWVSSCGIPGVYSASSDEIPAIYSHVVKHYIYHRVASMIFQFKEGLNSCGGLWDTMQSHWETFVPVMTIPREQMLTLEGFKELFTICYSQSDNPLRASEEVTAGHWEGVLTQLRDGQADFSFEDLLIFITGADHVPPLGFHTKISLCFYSQDVNGSGVRLPYASSCALELFLPRGTAATADLMMLLHTALHEELGFTRL